MNSLLRFPRLLNPWGCSLWRAVVWLACAGLGWSGSGVAAKPLPVPFNSEYQSENWGVEDGFPENSCLGIVAGPDGYLWIGTFRGLARFNGQNFRMWGPEAMPGLRSTGILSMYRDRGGRVWLSTMDGLISNVGDVWRRWTAAEGWDAPTDHVRSYAESAGQLVLTRFSGRVQRLENGRFQTLPQPPGTGGSLAGFDGDGGLYVFRAGHALWFNQGAWRPIAGEADLGKRAVGATQSRDGHAVIVCRDELVRLRGGRVVSRVRLSQPVASFWQATEDPAGTLWLPAVDAGLYRVKQDGSVRHFMKPDGLPHGGGTRIVHVAGDGSLWIGSGVGGITRFRPTRFRYLGEEEGMGDREVLTLTQLADGRMLFAPYGLGLKVFDGSDTVQPLRLGVTVPLYCRSLLSTRDGTLWLGANGAGLSRYANGTLTRVATEFLKPGDQESVHSLFEDSRGRLWVGGERHVLWHERGVFQRVPLPAANAGRRTIFAERKDGTILLGQQHEIFVFDEKGLRPEPLVRLPRETRISTLLADERDRIWIGTANHSLSVWHDGKAMTLPAARGLPAPTIASLVRDDRGQLWFGSGRSVMRADPEELWAAMQDPKRELRVLRFGRDDGIRSLDFTYGTQPNVLKDSQGRLWFALIRGAAMIDPATVTLNDRPPAVVVESISFVPDGEKQAVELRITPRTGVPILPAGSRLIRIHYAALDFFAPRKQRFRVALDGEWQDMHADNQVSFLELPPGRHTLQVQAAGSDGVWNRMGATLAFEIAPFYWQTSWFRGLIAAGLIGLVAGGVWFFANRRTRIAQDKLERERHLAEAQARLALVLENTSDFVAFADKSGTLVYLNRAGRALIGLEPDTELRAMPLNAILPPWAREHYSAVALPAAVAQGTWSGESALLRRSGREVPVSQVLIAHRSPDGALDFTSMIARDISVAKRHGAVQDALRRLATALTAALDPRSLGEAVAAACRTIFGHDAFFLMLLDDAQEVTLNAYMEDTPPGAEGPRPVATEIRKVSDLLRPVLAGKPLIVNRENEEAEVPGTVPFGVKERRSLSLMYAPVRWEGRTIGMISAQSYTRHRYSEADIEQLETLANHCAAAIARLNAEALLRKNEEQLRQSQKLEAVGTLAGGIAHDFNNILTAILGNAELASFDVGRTHPAREFLDKIRQSGMRARDLVRRILAFSRPQQSQTQATAPAPVVDEVVKLLRSTIPAIVEIGVRAEEAMPLVDIDSTELHQVLLNLGTNASHALGRRPGRIEFRIGACTVDEGMLPPAPGLEPGRYVRIAVSDTGCGIPAEVLPRIFDPFFTTKGPGEGSGLGLSVAHGIVRARGGAISVTSELGVGTTFVIYLPVSDGVEAPRASTEVAGAVPAATRGRQLLVVDDEEMIATTMKLVFTRAGFAVESFTTPAEALRVFRERPQDFDLAVTDLAMPGMSGVTLTQELRQLRPDLPVVMLSGYMRSSDRAAAELAGVSEIVEKPVTPQALLPAVARLLANKKK